MKNVASLKKQADKIFSRYVRLRDGKKINNEWHTECITCGAWKPIAQMQAGHFVSRSCNLLRYNEENVNAQCVGCNMFKGGEQYIYGKNLDLKYGDGTAEKLHNQRRQTHKLTIDELEQIIKDAKEYIKENE